MSHSPEGFPCFLSMWLVASDPADSPRTLIKSQSTHYWYLNFSFMFYKTLLYTMFNNFIIFSRHLIIWSFQHCEFFSRVLFCVGWLRHHNSDRERDEAVVLLNVPLENIWTRPKHSLKSIINKRSKTFPRWENPLPGSVQFDTLQRSLGCHGSSPGAVQHQSNLTKIVRRA